MLPTTSRRGGSRKRALAVAGNLFRADRHLQKERTMRAPTRVHAAIKPHRTTHSRCEARVETNQLPHKREL
eukprot:IDg20934t1